MPKRIVDGDALWRSDKLARIEPASYRAEFANLIPLALANGSFECNPRLIWSRCYAYNRPDITLETVEKILTEFERVGLLIRWEAGEKTWGYWVGIDKPGRLPSSSRQAKKHEAIGPVPPAQLLTGQPTANHTVASGEVGFGTGTGLGTGHGNGVGSEAKSNDNSQILPIETKAETQNQPQPQNPLELIRERKGIERGFENLVRKTKPNFGPSKEEWESARRKAHDAAGGLG